MTYNLRVCWEYKILNLDDHPELTDEVSKIGILIQMDYIMLMLYTLQSTNYIFFPNLH